MSNRVTQRSDPYAMLGVTHEASDDDLDHAFRALIRQLHPDTRNPSESDDEADKRLQELLTAYATLRDPVRRAAYDRTRAGAATINSASVVRHPSPSESHSPAFARVAPAIRVGPVRWQPAPRAAGAGSSGHGPKAR